MKNKILQLLKEKNDFVSGQALCERFNVSRTAVSQEAEKDVSGMSVLFCGSCRSSLIISGTTSCVSEMPEKMPAGISQAFLRSCFTW